MPDGDLASIVLEAARKERAKQDAGHSSAFGNGHANASDNKSSTMNRSKVEYDQAKDKGKGKARENGHAHPVHQEGNGFLEPPKAPIIDRNLTSSPEPLASEYSNTSDHAQPLETTAAPSKPAGEKDGAARGAQKDRFKQPAARKRPAARAGPSARKFSSAFFGAHGSVSGSNTPSRASKYTAMKPYTSESSMDNDDRNVSGASDHNKEFVDFFSANHGQSSSSRPPKPKTSTDTKNSSAGQSTSGNNASGQSKTRAMENLGKPGQTSNATGAMRGPFSRVDSSRGQTLLTRRQSIGAADAHDKTSYRQDHNQPQDSRQRRYSVSGAAQRFSHALGVYGHPNELDGSGDETESDAEGRRASRAHTPHAGGNDREARLSDVSHDHGLPKHESQEEARAGAARPPNRPQGVSRRSSYRSLNNLFRRSHGPGTQDEISERPDGEGTAGETGARHPGLSRSNTQADGQPGVGKKRWAQLKQKLKQEKKTAELDMTLNGRELINDLSLGMISVMMLKMAFDRDEHDQHRIPILLNYLKLRITDSVYPFHQSHALFRIELEYGDGLLKWVIYRELRDFVNLHTHYRVANVTHSLEHFPPFPKVSIPYFNLLRKESREKGRSVPGKAEFARMQREGLENYLLQLVRAVMFRPEANRLCKFLELSAMSLALATKRGGSQGKQGYLRVMSTASRHKRPGLHPLEMKRRHQPKWFMVRESYIVSTSEPADTNIWDVFLFDSDFQIERPKRLYRQGLGLFAEAKQKTEKKDPREEHKEYLPDYQEFEGFEGRSGGAVGDPNDPSLTTMAKDDPQDLKNASAHTFYIRNAERKLKLVAKSERQMDQFIASIEKMSSKTIWSSRNRFSSFAPIRMNCSAQWLVDGRDYFWNLSRAILLAKETVYIHDWWLSPELYLRRPPSENGRWRLDRLLQKKAEEGVKIFIIIYNEVSNDFTPVDSAYTKHRLLDLHPNIMVQRSPNHAQTRTLLWSHHEKMCVIDETIGFMGGLDLCFGRWDTPAHVLLDDGPEVKDDLDLPGHEAEQMETDRTQIWPGKDYANSRVTDFYNLNKPFEDMFDRTKTPREPWHDIGLQVIGHPAKDLCRHFVQRWNMLLRIKNHTRFMPFLLPPSDFTPRELENYQLSGTCEVQICRSSGPWSIGTPNKTEHSIQTAYLYAISSSKHFVYIENQFFITSTTVAGTAIENNIGNALVERIQRAHNEGTPWRAMILIPLEPGYPMPVDHPDAGSVRLIMECQFQSMCRGENSIFARLRRDGIDPNEYISFYSIRSWARMADGSLSTCGIYIHAKCMVVDDRIAIIGSANINERSQRGDRDSELACVIRDTDMIDSTMAGKPFKVGRFAHSLRVRLMREHLGIDVDAVEEEEVNMDLFNRKPVQSENDLEPWDPMSEQRQNNEDITKGARHHTRYREQMKKGGKLAGELADGALQAVGMTADKAMPDVKNGIVQKAEERVDGAKAYTTSTQEGKPTSGDLVVSGHQEGKGVASSVVPTLEEKVLAESGALNKQDFGKSAGGEREGGKNEFAPRHEQNLSPPPEGRPTGRHSTNAGETMDDLSKTIHEPTTQGGSGIHDTRDLAKEEPSSREDAATPDEIKHAHKATEDDTKLNSQENQDEAKDLEERVKSDTTKHTRHARADSNATAATRFSAKEGGDDAGAGADDKKHWGNEQISNSNKATDVIRKSIAAKMNIYSLPTKAPVIDAKKFADPLIDSFYKDMWMAAAVRNTEIYRKVFRCTPDDLVTTWAMMKEWTAWGKRHEKPIRTSPSSLGRDTTSGGPGGPPPPTEEDIMNDGKRTRSPTEVQAEVADQKKKAKAHLEESFSEEEIEQMAALLGEATGHLVVYPTRFLEGESSGQNFLWSKDRIPPIAIYD